MPVAEGIYYSTSGQGNPIFPPVLLIHGAGGTHLSWAPAIRRLKGYQIIAVDLPGHGHSAGTAVQSIEAYSYRLIGFLEALKISHVILIGHSMGGAVALTTAMRRPNCVKGLGLIAAGAFFGGETDILEHLSTPVGYSKAVALLQKRLFAAGADTKLVHAVMKALKKIRPGVLYSDWLACARFDIRQEVHLVKAPTWIAVGEEDSITPPSYAKYLNDQISGSTLQVIENAGHMVIQESAPELVLGFRAFLQRIDFGNRINHYQNHDLKFGSRQ